MRRVRFEPESDTKRQVVLTVDLIAMQDLPAKYVHNVLKLLNLTSSTGAGLRIKIHGLKAIAATTADKTVIIGKGAGATGGAKDEDSPIVELTANKTIFILDDANVVSVTGGTGTGDANKIKKRSVVFGSAVSLASVEPGFKLKEKATAATKNVLKVVGQEVFVDKDMTPDAAPPSTVTVTIDKPGKPADATLSRIDTISIGPVTVETDDAFADADVSRTFVDVNVKEGASGRETTKNIRTRFDDAFVIFVRQGEPAVSPKAAVVPADELPIADITVAAAVTVINDADIVNIDEATTKFDDRFGISFFDITAFEDLDDFDVIRIRPDGKAEKADSLNRTNSNAIGIIPKDGKITIASNPKGTAQHFGILEKSGAGFDEGEFLYLGDDGAMVNETTFLGLANNRYKVPVGMAITTEKFIFFGSRRLTAVDIPVEDTTTLKKKNVEEELKDIRAGLGTGLNFFGHNQAEGTAPATVNIAANAAPTRLLILVSIQAVTGFRYGTQLSKGGTILTFPGTTKQMVVEVDNDGTGRTGVSGHFLLKSIADGGTDYDSTIPNTFATTGSTATGFISTITVLGN